MQASEQTTTKAVCLFKSLQLASIQQTKLFTCDLMAKDQINVGCSVEGMRSEREGRQ